LSQTNQIDTLNPIKLLTPFSVHISNPYIDTAAESAGSKMWKIMYTILDLHKAFDSLDHHFSEYAIVCLKVNLTSKTIL